MADKALYLVGVPLKVADNGDGTWSLGVSRAVENVLLLAPVARSANGDSGSLSVGQFTELALDINLTALTGTSPSITFYLERQGADGNWYQIWASAALTATGLTTVSVGAGCSTNAVFGGTVRLRWALGGTGPSATFSASIIGK